MKFYFIIVFHSIHNKMCDIQRIILNRNVSKFEKTDYLSKIYEKVSVTREC